MIKRLKKLTVCLSAMLLLGGMGSTKALAATQTYRQANQIYDQVRKGYNGGHLGPINISSAVFNQGGKYTNVYLICLSGTELVKNQSTDLLADLQSGFDQKSDYLVTVAQMIDLMIPRNSNLIFAGHSLGGMIAQQASAYSPIKNNYNVLNVVTFGSPLISPFGREGTIRRLGDKSDVVPYLSVAGTILQPWQVAGLNTEDGGYGLDKVGAHSDSYKRADVWGAYDVVGEKWGGATLTFDPDKAAFFNAPIN